MSKRIIASLVAAGSLAAASPGLAQDAEEVIVPEQGGSELRVDWVLGSRVYSLEGERIGSIEDLILDEEDGAVNAAIVSVGGFLGIGSKSIALDWDELQIDYDANVIELDLTRDEAEAAEAYVFRDREYEPQPDMGTGTGTGTTGGTGGMGTGTTGSTF
ncbi:PRC-barrel domain-containing protein [Histidinibacterium lentulum]|uniref:PRC-barrel domain containing protein n=1 Tax=Histidinibacterium lentulum TaxID=2480588 RepID=A0A3N2QTC3_9RHOB|nr:PRC-barrel domain-containing protein [Histidinibacterium lentulum]ROT98448.1 PRC-barrel domain containing protein [Histidinibacterium lentulum]